MFLIIFPIFLTLFDHTLQTLDVPNHMPSQANQIYLNYNTLLAKHYQKAEFLRATSFSALVITVNDMLNFLQNDRCSFIFVILLMHETTSTISTKKFLQLISISLFRPYLFIKLFLQFPLILSSFIPQHCFTSLFLHKGILTIHIKSIFSTSVI